MDQQWPRVGFIGAGRVAAALALGLQSAGYDAAVVASRSFTSAHALAARLRSGRAVALTQDVVDSCDLVFITTPDSAIREAVGAVEWRPGVAAVHTSGVETRDALAVAAVQGAETASLHPLQTFAATPTGGVLQGICFGVEAEGGVRQRLLEIVAALGGRALELRAEDKALYHAAAVIAANYTVTLAWLATELWRALGVTRDEALRALLPLQRGALTNLESLGLPDALTGPVARGDVDSVARHLAALEASVPEVMSAYEALALQTIPVALARGGLSRDAAISLQALISEHAGNREPAGV